MRAETELTLFVSHHSSKVAVAEEIEQALRQQGISCWMAPRDVDPGEPFDVAVRQAIAGSSAILLLFCSDSDRSRHVKRELILADQGDKPIIPVRLEPIDPDALSYHLADSQWIDWPGQREAVIERIAAKARQFHGRGEGMTVVTTARTHALPGAAPATARSRGGALAAAAGGLLLAAAAVVFFLARPGGEGAGNPAVAAPTAAPGAAVRDAGMPVLSWPNHPRTAPGDSTTGRLEEAGFDCGRVSIPVERIICGSDELLELDRQLTSLYRRASAASADRATLERSHRHWREIVRDPCDTMDCIEDAYDIRVAQLLAAID